MHSNLTRISMVRDTGKLPSRTTSESVEKVPSAGAVCMARPRYKTIECVGLHRPVTICADKAQVYTRVIPETDHRYDPHFDSMRHIEKNSEQPDRKRSCRHQTRPHSSQASWHPGRTAICRNALLRCGVKPLNDIRPGSPIMSNAIVPDGRSALGKGAPASR